MRIGGAAYPDQAGLIENDRGRTCGQHDARIAVVIAAGGRGLEADREFLEGSENVGGHAQCAFDGPVAVLVLEEARLRLSRSCDQQERQQGLNEGQ